MADPYKNPEEAQQGLTSAFSPSTPEQTAAIQNAASLVPGASPAPAATTESPYYSRYNLGSTDVAEPKPIKAKTENQIVSEKTAAAQGQIDAINKHYQNLLGEQKIINEGRDRSTSSVNTLSGLAGSSEANIQQGKTTELNQKDNQKIQDQQNLQIQNLFGQIRASAVQEAQQSRLEARQSSQDAIAARTARQTEAVGQLTNLAKTGVTMAGLKATDPKSYDHLVKSLGGEEQVKAMFTLNRPAETILDKKIEGGKYIISYQNPLDGKIRIETLDLGLPPQYSKTVDAGDKILAIPDNWDGDPSKLITINKGLTPSQAAENGGAGGTATSQSVRENEAYKIAKELLGGTDKDGNPINVTGKSSAVGASFAKLVPGADLLGLQPDRTAFEAKVNTLKANLTLDNLSMLKGAMSDKDLAFLQAIGSSLDTNMSEVEFDKELTRIVNKFEAAGTVTPEASSVDSPPAGTDGASYGFPGYHSDGTQWVPN